MNFSSFLPYSIAGAATACVTQPIWNLKNISQMDEKIVDWRGRKLLFARVLYSGLTLNMLTIGATIGVRGPLFNMLSIKIGGKNPSEKSKLLAAITTGIFIAPVNTCIDNINLQKSVDDRLNIVKKNYTSSYKTTVIKLHQKQSFQGFSKGFRYTLMRDALFSSGLIYFSQLFSEKINLKINNRNISNILGGLSAGLFIATVTHPIDTMKTRVQRDIPIEFNIKSLMKGWYWRTTACTLMVGVFRFTKELIE